REVAVKFTRHGPVVLEDPERHRAYAVRATWLEPGGAPFIGALRNLGSKSVTEMSANLRHWRGTGINFVVADTSGKIGWFPACAVPRRSNTDGLLPLPGDGRYEWNGYLDRDLLPSEVDPERGFIATANQLVLPKEFPYAERPTSFWWIDDSRADRIKQVLTE